MRAGIDQAAAETSPHVVVNVAAALHRGPMADGADGRCMAEDRHAQASIAIRLHLQSIDGDDAAATRLLQFAARDRARLHEHRRDVWPWRGDACSFFRVAAFATVPALCKVHRHP